MVEPVARQTDSAAVSHVGRVRSNNQDSGYAGRRLFVVADGMGGHAGGDVASAIALKRIIEIDGDFATVEEAERELVHAIDAANTRLTDTVGEHPELTGMGTTVDAIALVDDRVVVAHIGDSRVYLFRDGELSQVTTDHTFVQRLVDAGRITPEEAAVHPRRSVLMRVLGDVEAHPEIDTLVLATRPGDRWLLCSDGLSGVVDNDGLLAALAAGENAQRTADRLLKASLDGGAPDNVTIVIFDQGAGAHPERPATLVGSAARPVAFEAEKPAAPRPGLFPSILRGRAVAQSHFEPDSEDYLDELIEEDARRARRRRVTWLVGTIVVILALVLGALVGYAWTQTRYFVGADEDTVVIYRGVQQDLGPFSLSSEYNDTGIPVSLLSTFDRQRIEDTINADSLEEAERIVSRLRQSSTTEAEQ